jgi:hypothetical protein
MKATVELILKYNVNADNEKALEEAVKELENADSLYGFMSLCGEHGSCKVEPHKRAKVKILKVSGHGHRRNATD